MRRLALTLVLLAVSAHAAFAQPSLAPINPVHEPQPAVQRVKDPTTARVAAIATTAAGFGLMYLAVDRDLPPLATVGLVTTIVGPSAGHIYAGEGKHALGSSALRAGGLLVFALGAVATTSSAADCIDVCHEESNPQGAQIAMAVGGLLVLGSAAYDIYDAGRAAERANAKHAASLRIAPTMMSANGQTMPAVVLGGTF